MTKLTLTELKRALPRPPVLIGWLVLIGVLGWAYSSVIARLVTIWWRNPDYGHGFFVPVFAVVLLWVRRDMVRPLPGRGSWWAVAFFALWAAMRCISSYIHIERSDEASLLPFIAGVALFVGGWRAMRWAWPSIVFLVFMVPLPGNVPGIGDVEGMLRHPLQRISTIASVYVVQTLGIPALAQGNVIQLPEAEPLGVAEACSGLRMLMLFFAVCVGAAFLLQCPLWKKGVIVVSAIPIAVFSNVTRITLTAFLHVRVSAELADKVFHNWAGYLMMPLALVLLWAEMALLDKLLLDRVSEGPLSLGGPLLRGPDVVDSQTTTNQHRQT